VESDRPDAYAPPVTELSRRFGAVIRQERKRKGVSQERLAQLSGLDRTYVQRIERGGSNPSLEKIDALARALQRLPSDLIALADGSATEEEDEEV
jgi:transcriptional regulator with XRE-family HTH domain